MYEEKAYLSKSLFYYQKASELPGIDRDTKIRSLCQILRLKSYIAPDETLSLVYETLVHAKTENENLITELQHSLMLAELSLFGHNFAKHRMLRALENKQNVSDERLIVADYLAECLRFNLPIEQSLVNKGQENLEEADHFERFIFEMATKHQHADPSSENIFELFHFMQNKIYLFNQIRLLDLIAHISPDPKIKTEAQRIISFKALSLPQEDRTLIHNRFLQTNQEINSLSLSRTKLFYAGQEVEIKTNIYKMLELLTSNPQFEVEQFCIAFYEESYSLSHFDRLRVFVIRTNEKLTKALGTKPLKLTKNHLEWRGPNISLTSK
ncbi:hypothetical protein [Bdellovibrio svalbardensis]|uniref:Uncharacterized protein n=1 Tax=Bdellovibrio svalbardensis TaxID=2972972 RepID=A0ABT6DKR0_9BACT|nr:hypothetical protein [Bdellovibrio svalbardensis]MDG0816499.1 hypothetical protein [Bdellovibrio svalbardensis]